MPPDFAHGFIVVSNLAQVLYKTTDYYAPELERSIIWDDRELGIVWPDYLPSPLLSAKDRNASSLSDAELPLYHP